MWFCTDFWNPRMEVGDDQHGLHNRLTKIQEAVWFDLGNYWQDQLTYWRLRQLIQMRVMPDFAFVRLWGCMGFPCLSFRTEKLNLPLNFGDFFRRDWVQKWIWAPRFTLRQTSRQNALSRLWRISWEHVLLTSKEIGMTIYRWLSSRTIIAITPAFRWPCMRHYTERDVHLRLAGSR